MANNNIAVKEPQNKREVKASEKSNKSDKQTELSFAPNQPVKKTRGRKEPELESYFEQGNKKIEELKEKLRTAKEDGIDPHQRQKWRNMISAQQSRQNKKK